MSASSSFFFLFSLFFLSVSCFSPNFLESLDGHLKHAEQISGRIRESIRKNELEDHSFDCAICGIVVNEIEAFTAENITLDAIEKFIRDDICSHLSGKLKDSCLQLADDLPSIVYSINKHDTVTKICMGLGYCKTPFEPHPDPVTVPVFKLNLDLPPKQRWKEICSVPKYKQLAQYLVNTISTILPEHGKHLSVIGEFLNTFFPFEYAQEIQGCAEELGVSYGWLSLLNLGYELSDACTSIVAQTEDGKIYHARNLDFWAGMGFTDTLRNLSIQVDFTKGGKTLFHTSGFAGYVGVLSGMKPNAFSMTVDTRFYPGGLRQLFYEVVAAITEKNASLVTFLSRDVFMNENDFEAAVNNLSNGELIADVYYIVAGVSNKQGAVISRNRINATDVWRLDPPNRWFEVETNYDHWKEAPWFDDRRLPANRGMETMGRKDLSLDGMLKVLSTKPVLNLQTTYSILACPADGTYKTYSRYCNYPCVE